MERGVGTNKVELGVYCRTLGKEGKKLSRGGEKQIMEGLGSGSQVVSGAFGGIKKFNNLNVKWAYFTSRSGGKAGSMGCTRGTWWREM